MNWLDSWGETFTGIFLLIGLIISLLVDAAIVSYIVIMLAGISVGRLYHIRRHRLGFPFFLITFGFLAGYLIGSIINKRGHWAIILVLFFIGAWFGEYIVHRKYCR